MILYNEQGKWFPLGLNFDRYMGVKNSGQTAIMSTTVFSPLVQKNNHWDRMFGFIYKGTAIVVGVNTSELACYLYKQESGLDGIVQKVKDIYIDITRSDEDLLMQIKGIILGEMWQMVCLKPRRRKALVKALETITDEHKSQYQLGHNYRLVKHGVRIRLYHRDVIAADFNCLSEVTKTHLCNDKRLYS